MSHPTALLAWLLSAIVIAALRLPLAQAEESPTAGNRNLNVASATKRVALVIGNAAYPAAGALKNPANDARDFGAKLKRLGFEVIVRTDLKQKDMLRSLTEFGDKVQPGTEALFFYAGHGMQVRGKNYLIPVDAEIKSEGSVSSEAVDVDQLLDKLAPARLSMVILDACRNNPFERRFRGGGQGLAQINAPTGTLIAYATAPGKVAADGEGRNGLYTAELLAAMDVPGIKIEDVFKRVRGNVVRKSSEAQTPWESSSLTGDFYFRATEGGVPLSVAAPAPTNAAEQPSGNMLAVELAYWQAAKESNDPAQLRAYLDRYPSGEFAQLARLRLEAESSPRAAAEPAQPVQALIDALPPSAFQASSTWSNDESGHGPANARYGITDTHSNWSSNTNNQNQWLQVDLQRVSVVRAIGTKGRHKCAFLFISCPPQWVTAYRIMYSQDGANWQYVDDGGVFAGNSDNLTEQRHEFRKPIKARYLRFHPQSWNDHITMRVEAYGYPAAP